MAVQASPGDIGRRLLPVTIDVISERHPDGAWASLPRDEADLSKGYADVSYASFANAINRMALLIKNTVGKAEDGLAKSVAYIGMPDIRYHVMSMATAKTGNKVLFSSHTHSTAGHVSLMLQCDCTALFSSSGIQVDDILRELPQLQHFVIPDFGQVFSPEPAAPYPFSKTFDEACNDTFLIFHTSGTTGQPKPIPITHGVIAALDSYRKLPEYEGEPPPQRQRRFNWLHPGQVRIFCPFVPFHSVSGYGVMISSVFGGATYVPGFKSRLAKPADALQVLRYANVDSAFVDPGTLEEIARAPDAAELLAALKVVIYSGGKPSTMAGELVSRHVPLQSEYGSTENGPSITFVPDPEDWEYVCFDTKHMGIDWRPVAGAKEHYEMVIVRSPEAEPFQAVFAQQPKLDEWPTHDIWAKHPTKWDAWRLVGRDDDLIAFADGNKLYPTPYEVMHAGQPFVKGAVLAGEQHHQVVLLLEIDRTKLQGSPITVDIVWPGVQEVNDHAPTNAQVAKDHILIAPSNKGFCRTDKGTVKRRATITAFQEEITSIYREHGDQAPEILNRGRQ